MVEGTREAFPLSWEAPASEASREASGEAPRGEASDRREASDRGGAPDRRGASDRGEDAIEEVGDTSDEVAPWEAAAGEWPLLRGESIEDVSSVSLSCG